MYMHDIRLTGEATAVAPGQANRGVTRRMRDKQATVTFAIPASDGGSAIKSYTANMNPGGKVATVAAPSTSIAATGLKRHGLYLHGNSHQCGRDGPSLGQVQQRYPRRPGYCRAAPTAVQRDSRGKRSGDG